MKINYMNVWQEDEATHRMPDHVTPAKKYEELSGETFKHANALQVIDRGDWMGFVLPTGYIVAEAAGGYGEVLMLPDVLTQPEIAEMVEALGGPEFFLDKTTQNRAGTRASTSKHALWLLLCARGFAITDREMGLSDPPTVFRTVTDKGKKELHRLYGIGRLTF